MGENGQNFFFKENMNSKREVLIASTHFSDTSELRAWLFYQGGSPCPACVALEGGIYFCMQPVYGFIAI